VDSFLLSIVGLAVFFADKGYLVKSAVAVCLMGGHGNYSVILIGASDTLDAELKLRCLVPRSLMLV
jgi:hypothetical protein